MSIADKIMRAKNDYDEVYDAGKEKIISIHPEKTVSGSYISANDVSELPHSVKCKVTGVDNPETVTVKRCGKNLLNPHNWSFSEIVKYNGVDCVRLQDSKDYSIFNGVFKENTRYTFTFKAYREAEDVDKLMVMFFEYTDGTSDGTHRAASSEIMTITSAEGKTVSKIKSGWNHSKVFYLDLSVSCLHEGTKASEYEPYNEQTLTPSADGTVKEMTSTSPQMNIFTDNADAMLDVTYRRSKGMQTEYDAFWDAFQDNGKRVDYECGFMGSGWNDATFRPKYDMKPDWTIIGMFQKCQITDLEKILNACGVTLDTSKNGNYQGAFSSNSFTVLPEIVFGKNTSAAGQVFSNCTSLHTIRKVTFTEGATAAFPSTFEYCTALANVVFAGVLANNINLQWCPLTRASIESLFSILSDTVSGKTVTLNKSAKEAAFTADEWAELIGTKTNWIFELM